MTSIRSNEPAGGDDRQPGERAPLSGQPGAPSLSETGSPTREDELIVIARIARPQGIRGEVVADILTDFPDRFAALRQVHLQMPGGAVTRVELERARPHKGRVVLKFRGIERIEQAETLRGARVVIERERLVPLPPDTWYHFELIGCQVVRPTGSPDVMRSENAGAVESGDDPLPGRVIDVQEYGAAPLLIVEGRDGRELMIPLASGICVEVDVARRLIVVDPPEGLFD